MAKKKSSKKYVPDPEWELVRKNLLQKMPGAIIRMEEVYAILEANKMRGHLRKIRAVQGNMEMYQKWIIDKKNGRDVCLGVYRRFLKCYIDTSITVHMEEYCDVVGFVKGDLAYLNATADEDVSIASMKHFYENIWKPKHPPGSTTSSEQLSENRRRSEQPSGSTTSTEQLSEDRRSPQQPSGSTTSSVQLSENRRSPEQPSENTTSSVQLSENRRSQEQPSENTTSSVQLSENGRSPQHPSGSTTSSEQLSEDRRSPEHASQNTTSSEQLSEDRRSPEHPSENTTSAEQLSEDRRSPDQSSERSRSVEHSSENHESPEHSSDGDEYRFPSRPQNARSANSSSAPVRASNPTSSATKRSYVTSKPTTAVRAIPAKRPAAQVIKNSAKRQRAPPKRNVHPRNAAPTEPSTSKQKPNILPKSIVQSKKHSKARSAPISSQSSIIKRKPAKSLAPQIKLPRNPRPRSISRAESPSISQPDIYEVDPEGEVYCYCHEPSYDRMIACDSGNCPFGGWIHLGCEGLTVIPAGKWYCRNCRQHNNDMGEEPSPPRFRIIKEEPVDDYEEPSRPSAPVPSCPVGMPDSEEEFFCNHITPNAALKEEPPDDHDESVYQEQPLQRDAPDELITVNGDENVALNIECASEPEGDAPLLQNHAREPYEQSRSHHAHQPDENSRSLFSSDSDSDSEGPLTNRGASSISQFNSYEGVLDEF